MQYVSRSSSSERGGLIFIGQFYGKWVCTVPGYFTMGTFPSGFLWINRNEWELSCFCHQATLHLCIFIYCKIFKIMGRECNCVPSLCFSKNVPNSQVETFQNALQSKWNVHLCAVAFFKLHRKTFFILGEDATARPVGSLEGEQARHQRRFLLHVLQWKLALKYIYNQGDNVSFCMFHISN